MQDPKWFYESNEVIGINAAWNMITVPEAIFATYQH